jgi:preprotein translocase SecE subunit
MKKLARFLVGVKAEMKKVKWPEKKQMIENSVATLTFILVFGIFFTGIDLILSIIKTVIN